MRADLASVASRRRRALDQWAAATHHRAAQCHEAAVTVHSEAVVFFRSRGQLELADREHRLVGVHLSAASWERKLAASHWGAAAQREVELTIRLRTAAGDTEIGDALR
jgi:hypothetical protein